MILDKRANETSRANDNPGKTNIYIYCKLYIKYKCK